VESDQSPVKLKINYDFFKVAIMIISGLLSCVVFMFATFATKGEMIDRRESDAASLSIIRDDVRELRKDVKEILKHTRGN
jgi:hypothetical protein